MAEMLATTNELRRAKLTVRDFLMLNEHGAFKNYRKTELLDGEVYFGNAHYRPHGRVKTELYDALRDALTGFNSPYRPMQEVSVALSDGSMPEPEITLTSEPMGVGAIPVRSIPLAIEVSDTTLDIDLGLKSLLYASAGIPEYWVADVDGRVLHRMWVPVGTAYSKQDEVKFGQQLVSRTLNGLVIESSAL